VDGYGDSYFRRKKFFRIFSFFGGDFQFSYELVVYEGLFTLYRPQNLEPQSNFTNHMRNELILRKQENNQNQIFHLSTNKTPRSPALREITSRALEHIRQNAELNTRIQVRDYELCPPDYQLLCDLSLQLKRPKENLLAELIENEDAELINGQFKRIRLCRNILKNHSRLTISSTSLHLNLKHLTLCFNQLEYLKIEIVSLKKLDCAWNLLTELDLSQTPNLTHLHCMGNNLKDINLSKVPNLTHLHCDMNKLSKLNLSNLYKLTQLHCDINKLRELDLSPVPHLKFLFCNDNKLTQLDFSNQHHITTIVPHTDESTFAPLESPIFDPEAKKLHFYCDSGTKIIKLNNQKIQTI